MKFIFLDIDGVLNSRDWQNRRGPDPVNLTPQARDARAFDPDAVALLGTLLERSKAALVLSSTWRLDGGARRVTRALGAHGLHVRFAGVTPDGSRFRPKHGRWNGCPRGTEIARWLFDHSQHVDSITILDDERPEEFGHLAPWHVQTNSMQGLEPHHVEEALTLLDRERDDTLRLAYYEQRDVFRP